MGASDGPPGRGLVWGTMGRGAAHQSLTALRCSRALPEFFLRAVLLGGCYRHPHVTDEEMVTQAVRGGDTIETQASLAPNLCSSCSARL